MFHIAYFTDDDEQILENIELMQEQLLPTVSDTSK